jgi:hypothetical protein
MTLRDKLRPHIAARIDAGRNIGLKGKALKKWAYSFYPLARNDHGQHGIKVWHHEVRVQLGEVTFPRRKPNPEAPRPLFDGTDSR